MVFYFLWVGGGAFVLDVVVALEDGRLDGVRQPTRAVGTTTLARLRLLIHSASDSCMKYIYNIFLYHPAVKKMSEMVYTVQRALV
jgi:hypothetical protein